MKVKSFTYERSWTGKYYRQRLLPSMQSTEKHVAAMTKEGWELMTESAHSGNGRGFKSRLRIGIRLRCCLRKGRAQELTQQFFAFRLCCRGLE
jgi:hypothetical protein